MSHFYATIQGDRGPASRRGSREHGISATIASWRGAIRVFLYHDADTGEDCYQITLEEWAGYTPANAGPIATGVIDYRHGVTVCEEL